MIIFNSPKPPPLRKIVLPLLVLAFASQLLQAQKPDSVKKFSPEESHDYYIKKKKTNTNIGCIVLLSGAATAFAGLAINLNELLDYGSGTFDESKGLGLVYIGLATSVLSIPFFIAAGKNKRRAQLALKNETVMIGNKIHFKVSYPVISFILQL